MSESKYGVLVVKFRWRIRPVVIKNVVGWKFSENGNLLHYTDMNGSVTLSLKNFVSLKYIEK
ncbi:MAG: hypothetical protein NC253_11345 [Ruminococcus sp.]|nr:hypothetical protein [Ruminococcus sp.]MCM1382143.1 hypothetical protein [Muribaculaceae bacterium]MCM1480826.1 hypothetical protein [Muribaculaceae bacterium]